MFCEDLDSASGASDSGSETDEAGLMDYRQNVEVVKIEPARFRIRLGFRFKPADSRFEGQEELVATRLCTQRSPEEMESDIDMDEAMSGLQEYVPGSGRWAEPTVFEFEAMSDGRMTAAQVARFIRSNSLEDGFYEGENGGFWVIGIQQYQDLVQN